MASPTDVAAMRRALELARLPDAPLGPNPRVGCVLLSPGGDVLAEGYGRGAGERHAEIDALRQAGEAARGATAVVTLEPCNHTGRTGPCARALRDAGVGRVVYAQADRSPWGGGGAAELRTSGIDVEGGVLEDEARAINPVWTFAVEAGRPYVTWKFAATLDGRSAAADGSSRWITSLESRADVHRLRAQCDAILVGTGTVLADDPRLTVRDDDDRPLDRRRQPLRAVLGLREIPPDAAVLDSAAETVRLATRDPAEGLAQLFARGHTHVWLEGGPTVAGAFWKVGLVDRVVAYLAPALLGAGPAALGDAGVSTVDAAVRLEITDITAVGPDVRLTATSKG